MTKLRFLETLSDRLAAIPHGEAQRVLNFYSEAIDDRIEDGMAEADAVAAVGDVDAIAREILGDVVPVLHETDGSYRFAVEEEAQGGGADALAFDPAQVKTVLVQTQGADVHVRPGRDGLIRVEGDDVRSLSCALGEDGTLNVRRLTRQRKGSFLGISFNVDVSLGEEVTLLLPEGCTPPLSVTTTSGDVALSVRALEALHVRTASGDVEIDDLTVARSAAISTVSGDPELRGLRAENLEVTTTSGDAKLTDVCVGMLGLRTVSGDFDLTGGMADELSAVSTSGDMDLFFDGALRAGRFESVSGDYSLRVGGGEDGYRVSVRDARGRESVRGPEGGAPLVFKTLSGDIELKFDE